MLVVIVLYLLFERIIEFQYQRIRVNELRTFAFLVGQKVNRLKYILFL